MGKKSAPVNVIFYYPKTEEVQQELAQRIASVHANFVLQYIRKLNCPSWQKEQLLDAVIESSKQADTAKKLVAAKTKGVVSLIK